MLVELTPLSSRLKNFRERKKNGGAIVSEETTTNKNAALPTTPGADFYDLMFVREALIISGLDYLWSRKKGKHQCNLKNVVGQG